MNVNIAIMQTLKDIGVPVSFLVCKEEPKPALYVTFFEVNADESDYADDKAITEEINVQVDIWATFGSSISGIRKSIITSMKSNGWALTNQGTDLYESDTNVLHKVLEFKYEGEVE